MSRFFRSETPGLSGYGSLLLVLGTFAFVMLLVIYPETITGAREVTSLLR